MKNEVESIRELALFRYNLRRFLRFSEKAARASGVTPQQHQLMLGIAGFTEDGSATISDLAEFLQERNNSVVGLVERAAERGLVRRRSGQQDRRQVVVTLTARGEDLGDAGAPAPRRSAAAAGRVSDAAASAA